MSPGDPEPRLVILDGRAVKPAAIDPAKHRFVGMFRPPVNPLLKATERALAAYHAHVAAEHEGSPWPRFLMFCRCGGTMELSGDDTRHYEKGCCDALQYATID